MTRVSLSLCVLLPILLLLSGLEFSLAFSTIEGEVKKQVFMSPGFVLEPGSVSNKYYYNIDFPRGHIALKSFNGEVVDEQGNPVSLHDTYLHHWVVVRYYQKSGYDIQVHQGDLAFHSSNFITVKNSGLCDHGLIQYFGLGSETRKTATRVPDPYGVEVGNPVDIPSGFEERWMLNVHAIDTREAEDRMGCTECRCDLYNITVAQDLPPNYIGGLLCCEDQARCRVKEGIRGIKRVLYLRYTVEYVDWSSAIVPVNIFIIDVTDIWRKADQSRGIKEQHTCLIEYEVHPCSSSSSNDACTHSRTLTVKMPTGGDVIYGVGHQHSGGTGITLLGEGGRHICSSIPEYGKGTEPGNEDGHIVGMSTCYPSPGSIKISAGEMLTLVSNYSSAQLHTGVMGLFYILVAEQPDTLLHAAVEGKQSSRAPSVVILFAVFGAGAIAAIAFLKRGKKEGQEYEAIP